MSKVAGWIDNSRDGMTRFMLDMLKIKAVNPDGGGQGEYRRAVFFQKALEGIGLRVTRYDIPDKRVDEGVRVNLAATLEGEDRSRTLWFAAHLDTVPEGSRELWSTDPFSPTVREGKIFARGAEDNGQSCCSAFFLVKAMKTVGVKPKTNVGLAYVSDEESGSKYGVIPLLEKGIFKPTDMALVPDGGSPDGSQIEIAEKSILWLKIITKGKQVHGSTPEKGLNARRAAMKFAIQLDDMLHSRYPERDALFEPPASTFEPTKSDANVENVNTVPGLDVQCFDCRILPKYPLDEVMKQIDAVRLRVEKETGASIQLEPLQFEQNENPTPIQSPIVLRLKEALKELRGVDASPIGIGGGTVGAYFRRKGMDTVVWSTVDDVAHQPNEYCKIKNLVEDAKVFAYLATT